MNGAVCYQNCDKMLEPPLSNSFASSESGISTDVGQKPIHVGSLARRRTLSNSLFIILCFLVIRGSFVCLKLLFTSSEEMVYQQTRVSGII